MYWLYLYQDKVVHTLELDRTPTADDWPGTDLYDTIAQDDSKTFKVGDIFTSDLQIYYNRNIWKDMGWIDANVSTYLETNPPNVDSGLVDWTNLNTENPRPRVVIGLKNPTKVEIVP